MMKKMDDKKLDIKSVVEDYLEENGWKARANSNSGYSFSGLVLHTAGANHKRFISDMRF